MRELRRSRDKYLPPVKLFLDDVDQIERIMVSDGDNRVLNLTTSEYELDNLRELGEINRSQIEELHFKLLEPPSNNPLVVLDIEPQMVRIHTDEETTTIRGIMDKIEDLLYPKRLRISAFPERAEPFVLAMAPMGLGVLLLGLVAAFGLVGPAATLVLISALILVVASLGLMLRSLRARSQIVLRRWSEQDTFWKRNHDLLLVVVTAALTFVATLLGTWAAGLLLPIR